MTRDHAAAVLADGLAVVALASSRVIQLDLRDIVDLVPVADEVWVAAGRSPMLHRIAFKDGATRGTPIRLEPDGRFVPLATGRPGALWAASPPRIYESDGTTTDVDGAWDFVLPITAHRRVVCTRTDIAMRDGARERWITRNAIQSGRIVDGAIVFDGRSAALVVARNNALAQLLVLNLHDGAVQQRVTLTDIALVRFAAARGVAVMFGKASTVVFDLRFGSVLLEHADTGLVTDAAVDPTGQTLVVRRGERLEDIEFGAMQDLLAERAETAAPSELVAADSGLEPPEPDAAPVPDFHRSSATLSAFESCAPLRQVAMLAPGEWLEHLDRHRRLLAALVGRAIARGWDSGQIEFPQESRVPFRNEVLGILGEGVGRARDDVDNAERRVVAAAAAVREAELAQTTRVSPLAALARELGLSPLACTLVFLIAGPALWGELARLYGILSNDEARPLVDEMLLAQILTGEADSALIARELDPDAPLLRYGIVLVGEARARPFIGLSCDPVVLAILRGEPRIRRDDMRIVEASCSFDDLLVPASDKEAIVQALERAASPARISVRGRSGSGRHTLMAAVAAACGRSLAVIDAGRFVHHAGGAGQLATVLFRAHMLGYLPCVDGLEAISTDDRLRRDEIRHVLVRHPGPIVVRLPWDARPLLGAGHTIIDLPSLSLEQRVVSWELVLRDHDLYVRDPSEVAGRYGVAPGVMHRVCERVVSSTDGSRVDRTIEVEGSIRQHLESELGTTATRVARLSPWSRVVLPPDLQESVLELIARIKHRRTVYHQWGYDQILTTSRGVTALFQGGPGTGKTMVAGAIANELGMDLYRVDLSRIMSKWIGETEQNLAKLFDAAEDGHAIILFDEADSLFAKRTEVRTSVDRYANLEVNYLLQRLDTFEGIAILTTNFGTSIDGAFKRRMSLRVTFPFPDEDAREALWKSHVPPGVPTSGEFDFGDLARRFRLSGGFIRNAAIRAAFLAAEEHVPLTQQHLVRAVQAEFREVGKIAESGQLE